MGSTGTGSFSDYSRKKPVNSEDETGGSSGVDKCALGFSSYIEEVSRCFYYLNYAGVPETNTDVRVIFNGIRLAVENLRGEELGYLPTEYNYLRYCLEEGYEYSGVVSGASDTTPPKIMVDITPTHG